LRKAAGLDTLRFHDLRHTFITMMGERGVPLAVLENMVGHLSAKMVRHYTHVSSQAARRAVELLDQTRFVENLVEKTAKAADDSPKLLN
jgi:integrase